MQLTYKGPGAPDLDLGNGVKVATHWSIAVTEISGFPGTIDIGVAFDAALKRFAADSVHARREEEGTEVTGVILREVKVQDFVQQMAVRAMFVERSALDPGGRGIGRVRPILDSIAPVSGRTTIEHVRQAAFIYRVSQVLNYAPLKSVADILKVSQSTATRLVARARREGLLEGGGDTDGAPTNTTK